MLQRGLSEPLCVRLAVDERHNSSSCRRCYTARVRSLFVRTPIIAPHASMTCRRSDVTSWRATCPMHSEQATCRANPHPCDRCHPGSGPSVECSGLPTSQASTSSGTAGPHSSARLQGAAASALPLCAAATQMVMRRSGISVSWRQQRRPGGRSAAAQQLQSSRQSRWRRCCRMAVQLQQQACWSGRSRPTRSRCRRGPSTCPP